jgi:hypothetical protein
VESTSRVDVGRLGLLKRTGIVLVLLLTSARQVIACPDYKSEVLSKFPSALSEASGLIHGSGNFWWSHNDSGDGPFLYAVDPKGKLLGKVEVQGAKNIDWEELTAGPCLGKSAQERCLYIGDIGDNSRWRDDATIYAVREPTPKDQKINLLATLPLRYPDRPANSEAFVYDVQGKQFLIFTKERNGRVFTRSLNPTEPTLKQIATVDLSPQTNLGSPRLVTGAALSQDGRTLLLRSYLAAFRWFRAADEPWSKVLARLPVLIPLLPEAQGEAIAFGPEDQDFYSTSEKVPNLAHYSCAK